MAVSGSSLYSDMYAGLAKCAYIYRLWLRKRLGSRHCGLYKSYVFMMICLSMRTERRRPQTLVSLLSTKLAQVIPR